MSDEPDWRDVAIAYTERIHHLERIAIADQQSYRALQVENENLKHRLSMAESNNPESVLSKHNAMLMARDSRDDWHRLADQRGAALVSALAELETANARLLMPDGSSRIVSLKTELDTLKRQLTEEAETRGKLEAELERVVAQSTEDEMAVREAHIKTGNELHELKAELEAMKLVAKAYQDAEGALQAKVAVAVALLEAFETANESQQIDPEGVEHAWAALEALR